MKWNWQSELIVQTFSRLGFLLLNIQIKWNHPFAPPFFFFFLKHQMFFLDFSHICIRHNCKPFFSILIREMLIIYDIVECKNLIEQCNILRRNMEYVILWQTPSNYYISFGGRIIYLLKFLCPTVHVDFASQQFSNCDFFPLQKLLNFCSCF